MKIRVLISFLALTAGAIFSAPAADLATPFDAANKFYAEGKYAAAATVYEQAIQQAQTAGVVSPVLYFNDGNAEFKLGHLGLAIVAYRHAALLTPRDSEVLGNLEFVRNQVQGATVHPSHWQNGVGSLTLNEGTGLTAGAFWLAFILLTIRQIRPALAPRLRGPTLALIGITILAGAVLVMQAVSHFYGQTAVVIDANAVARSGPFLEAQNAFAVHDGAELSVLDRHDDWLQVSDGTGRIGWLPGHELAVLPGA